MITYIRPLGEKAGSLALGDIKSKAPEYILGEIASSLSGNLNILLDPGVSTNIGVHWNRPLLSKLMLSTAVGDGQMIGAGLWGFLGTTGNSSSSEDSSAYLTDFLALWDFLVPSLGRFFFLMILQLGLSNSRAKSVFCTRSLISASLGILVLWALL